VPINTSNTSSERDTIAILSFRASSVSRGYL
jgi:hypothetical protein